MEGILGVILWIVIICLGVASSKNKTKKLQSQEKPEQASQAKPAKAAVSPARQARPIRQASPARQASPIRQTRPASPVPAPAATPEIVARAKANASAYIEDETLEELETEHHHSEKVSTAKAAYVEKERQAHEDYHKNPHPPVEEESCLGSLEDLMVKGYSGNLSFERDFVAEGMDMINRFTL